MAYRALRVMTLHGTPEDEFQRWVALTDAYALHLENAKRAGVCSIRMNELAKMLIVFARHRNDASDAAAPMPPPPAALQGSRATR